MRPGDIALAEYYSLMKHIIGSEDRTRNQLTDNVINKGKIILGREFSQSSPCHDPGDGIPYRERPSVRFSQASKANSSPRHKHTPTCPKRPHLGKMNIIVAFTPSTMTRRLKLILF